MWGLVSLEKAKAHPSNYSGGIVNGQGYRKIYVPIDERGSHSVNRNGYMLEIEKRGYLWEMADHDKDKYPDLLRYSFKVIRKGKTMDFLEIGLWGDSPEDAAAEALLWILREQNAKV